MKNVSIKSRRMYHVSALCGLVHDISLVCREYRSGRCIYILKCIITYHKFGVQGKQVFKKVYYDKDTALRALYSDICHITLENIDFQIELPF